MKRATQISNNPRLLSELSESQGGGNHQDLTSISVGEYARLGRPAIQ